LFLRDFVFFLLLVDFCFIFLVGVVVGTSTPIDAVSNTGGGGGAAAAAAATAASSSDIPVGFHVLVGANVAEGGHVTVGKNVGENVAEGGNVREG